MAITTLLDAAFIAWNATNPGTYIVTLEGNRTLNCPSSIVEGAEYTLIVEQDSTGGRSLSYNACFNFPGSVKPSLGDAPYERHILTFVSESTSGMTLKNASKSVGKIVVPPSNLSAVGGVGSANLSWDDNSSDETGFVIEWQADPILNQWVQIGSVGANVEAFEHFDLPGEYVYRVRAVRNEASSLPSATTSAIIEE